MNNATKKDLTIVGLVLTIGFLLGLVTCNSFKKCPGNTTGKDTVREIVLIPEQKGLWKEPPLESEKVPPPNRIIQPTDTGLTTVGEKWPGITKWEYIDNVPDTVTLAELKIEYFKIFEAYEKLLSDYATIRGYADTTHFSSASVLTEAVVSQNRLLKWRTSLMDSLEQVTITHPTQPKKTLQAYYGIIGGWQPNPQSAWLGASFSLKLKSDYQVGIKFMGNNRLETLYMAEVEIPIKRKK